VKALFFRLSGLIFAQNLKILNQYDLDQQGNSQSFTPFNNLDPDTKRKNKVVAYWLLLGVFMIIIQTLLGGVTRLTGSGLSITEWDVVTGTLPPLNEAAWLKEFAKYQKSPQYLYLNSDFTLSDFKSIFFWEWFHRFWARLIGIVFAVPFIFFLGKKIFQQTNGDAFGNPICDGCATRLSGLDYGS